VQVNGALGGLGRHVRQKLTGHPDGLQDGEYQWWHVLATGERHARGWVWTLRPEVRTAAAELGWLEESELSLHEETSGDAEPSPRDRAAAYRFNWNPDVAPRDLTETQVDACDNLGFADAPWRCGNARIELGQRLFLMRTGKGPRGLVGVGQAIGHPSGGELDDKGAWVPRTVLVRFTVLSRDPLVARELLDAPPLDTVHWDSQAAAARLDDEQARAIETLVAAIRTSQIRHPEEVDVGTEFAEGATRQILVNAFERSRRGRDACIAHWGPTCAVCDLNFGSKFGNKFAQVVHAHHLIPISQATGKYRLDPVRHLRPVCPNCHAMLHVRRPDPFTIEELRAIVHRRPDTLIDPE